MASVKLQRRPVRTAFTKTLKELEEELNKKDDRDNVVVGQLFRRLEGHRTNLNDLNEKVTNELLQKVDVTEADFEEEYTSVTEYEEKFTDVQILYNAAVNKGEDAGSEKSSSYQSIPPEKRTTKYRLPKLEFQKFGGDPKDWLRFWSQFSSVHEDETMQPGEKFQYLVQATLENSKAREVINSFPPTGENYEKAVTYLKERFGKEEVLVEVYVRDMLRLVLDNAMKKTEVSSLYDKLETQLRALSSLGVTQEKYAAMLYPLVESCLPEETLRAWERQRHMRADPNRGTLECLMEFLRSEVEGEERILMAKGGFTMEGSSTQERHRRKEKRKREEDTPTALDLHSGTAEKSSGCVFCGKGHPSNDCYTAARLSLEKKKKILSEKGACFTCLKTGHRANKCKLKPLCQACQKRHLVLMCPETLQNKAAVVTTEGNNEEKPVTNLTSHSSGAVLLQTLLVIIKGPRGERCVRVLIDTGSQRSYVSRKAVEVLGLRPSGEVQLAHSLFGGTRTEVKAHKEFEILLQAKDRKSNTRIHVLDQETICGQITRGVGRLWLKELQQRGVMLTDVGDGCPDIHVLIGADHAGTFFTGRIERTTCGPVAWETVLGWTVMGPTNSERREDSLAMLTTSLVVTDADIQSLWRLDAIGISDPSETESREEEEKSAEDHFKKTISVNSEGRYEVHLPWLECHPPLSNNYEVAKKRLNSATRKLKTEGLFNIYQQIFDVWEKDGVVEKVSGGGGDLKGSYLPHRPVLKPTSLTTPVRPVFDASAKSGGHASLNECLQKGTNLIELIPDIMMRFRLKKIGVVSDVKKAFLQISVRQEDRDYLRFLWWAEDQQTIQEYRHCRVVFGITSSPFLLAATLNHHLDKYAGMYPAEVELLKRSLYIDNCVASLDSEEETQLFIQRSTEMLAEGKFELRGWTWTGRECDPDEVIVPVLGMLWDTKRDTMKYDLRSSLKEHNAQSEESGTGSLISRECRLDSGLEVATKRVILSAAHKVFDPIGVSSPVMMVPKKLLQQVWLNKKGWDDPVGAEVEKDFLKWKKDLPHLEKLEMPRWVAADQPNHDKWSLHVFSDASKEAYAGCVFLCVELDDGKVNVELVTSKVRVAPTKKTTIPRLELLGCLVAARLASSSKKSMGLLDMKTYFWTDSSNALHWIVKRENWATFVWNRVEEIRRLTQGCEWRHVPGEFNPADLPSRGCGAKSLANSEWWKGPSWLCLDENQWPKSEVVIDPGVMITERRKVVAMTTTTMEKPWYVGHFSSFRKRVRMVGWMQRLTRRSSASNLTVGEESAAEIALLRAVQSFHYTESTQLLKQLNAVKDKDGLWRVKTKLVMREDTESFRFPILLPGSDETVQLLVRDLHLKNSHCGVQVLLSMLRENYWIPKTRQTVRKIVSSCVKCRRFDAKNAGAVEAPLPMDRVKDTQVFEVVGVDLGGPLYLKEKTKSWFVVFTCAVYRAVHLELVTSLSTESFIQALRRLVARRGRPSVIYSDQGTNFEGASNALNRVDWSRIAEYAADQKIRWEFNPPSAPWWGGWWERIVGMVKKILRRVLGRATLTYEEMLTVLLDCEEVINSRPLTYVSEDIDDLIPLTPNLFLRETKSGQVPDLDQLEAEALNKRFQYRQKLKEDLRRRFRSEYLGMLVHKMDPRKKPQVKIGDVVLIGCDNKKRQDWPLGRVEELYPGRDGVERLATVKTAQGALKRPVQRLYQMEMAVEDAPATTDVVTRSGRRVKPVARLGY